MNVFLKSLIFGPLLLAGPYLALAYLGGLPPFYYVEFNRVKANLESIEGLEILNDWQHHDISLEGCGFTVRTHESEAVSFDFRESDDWGAPFEHLDGVIFTDPVFPGTSRSFGRVFLDEEALREAGVEEVNLKGVLRNLEKVLAVVKARESLDTEQKLKGEWMVIRYDLERYRNPGVEEFKDEPEVVERVVNLSQADREFLRDVEVNWKRHSYSGQSPGMKIFDELGVEATIPNLVRGWVNPGLWDGVLRLSAPLSCDGLVRVESRIAFVKVNRNLVMIYREKEEGLIYEIWKNED